MDDPLAQKTPAAALGERPVAACFLPVFLKPEMWHIYRQINGLQGFCPVIFAHKRENATDFPLAPDQLRQVPRPPGLLREVRSAWCKHISRAPVTLFPWETRRLEAGLRSVSPQVLHVYFGHIGLYLLPLLERWPGPKVVSYHGADAGVDVERPAWAAASRRLFASVDLVIARSQSLLDSLAALGCPTEKLALHRTGVPLDQFPQTARVYPADGQWRLLQACRLIEKKGLRTTLEAFREFRQRHPAARLTIAGEGPMQAELQALGARWFPPGALELPGFVRQKGLRQLYAQSHIFLHPSETAADGNVEGVPNSMLEAMATGLPVAATLHGGIPEALTSGRGGLLVPERDAAGLARALLEIAGSPERYATFAQGAAEEVREKFDLRRQVQVLEDLYARAIQRAAGRKNGAIPSAT